MRLLNLNYITMRASRAASSLRPAEMSCSGILKLVDLTLTHLSFAHSRENSNTVQNMFLNKPICSWTYCPSAYPNSPRALRVTLQRRWTRPELRCD